MKYLWGTIFIVVGFVIVWQSEWMYNNFGAIDFAESKMGNWGGTRFFYKLIGIVIILGSFMLMSGLLGTILKAIFTPNTPAV